MNPLRDKAVRRPGLRTRVAAGTALAVFVSLNLAAASVTLVAARTTAGQVEAVLRTAAASLDLDHAAPGDGPAACAQARRQEPLRIQGLTDVVIEVHGPGGQMCRGPGNPALDPLTPTGGPLSWLLGTTLPRALRPDGTPVLVLTRPLPQGWSIRLGADLTAVATLAGHLLWALLAIGLLGAVLSAVTGIGLARRALRPVRDLAATAEAIAATQDLSVRIGTSPTGAGDEVARLARAFDRMTTALAQARDHRARLITDAGHELRTPLTSLRGNIQLLLRSERTGRPLPPDHRTGLLDDLDAQSEEFGRLIDELARLAPHEQQPRPRNEARFDEIVRRAVDRLARRGTGHRIESRLDPWTLANADTDDLERAVVNLLDNALKFAPATSTVRVTLTDGRLTVDDEGPGVPDAQRESAFERFWRADHARSLPGSGLGLAIVAAAAAGHGGSARLEAAPGGGTRAVLELPGRHPTA